MVLNMYRLYSLFFFLFLLFFPTTSISQTISSTNTPGVFTFLEKGQKAPFAGTLFDKSATAYFLIDKETREDEYTLKLNKELDRFKIDYELKLTILNNQFNNEKEKNKKILDEKGKQIENLTKKAISSTNFIDDVLKIGGGSVAGAALAILLVLIL